MDIAVSEYKKRRAERLAVRGIRPKFNPNWDYPLDITSYQKRRDDRLLERGLEPHKEKYDPFRFDAPDDDNNNNSGGGDSGGHGNTRLPFGLCMRYGIAIEPGWQPRDAWAALAGKGITPDGAFSRLKEGKDPGVPDEVPPEPKKAVNVTIGVDHYKVTGAEYVEGGGLTGEPWVLKGYSGYPDTEGELLSFKTKRDMYKFLKDQGVEEFADPETGEIVNPTEMKIPKTILSGLGYGSTEYGGLDGYFVSWASRGENPWRLRADKIAGTGEDYSGYKPGRLVKSFWTKEDMLYYLKEHGIEEFKDPQTGELVNPVEMELPKKVITDRFGTGYQDLAIGLRGGEYTLIGTDLAGKKRKLGEFDTLAKAKSHIEALGGDPEVAKLSPALKKREKERVSWIDSPVKQYVEVDGKRYGDLELEHDTKWRDRWVVTGESEDGEKRTWEFRTKAEAMRFCKEQGVEKIREGKERPNPMEYEIPETVFKDGDKEYQEIGLKTRPWGKDVWMYGIDLDGREHKISGITYRETFGQFKERLLKDYNLTEDQLKISDESRAKIEEIQKEEEEKERRRKEFESKATPFGSSRYVDPELDVDSDGDYSIYGYDSDGDRVRVSGWGDLYDMEEFCKNYGYDLQQFIKKPEMQEAYDKYKEARKTFDATAIDLGGGKYAGVEITYDGSIYRVRGVDARGRTKEPIRERSFEALERTLSEMGHSVDDISIGESAKGQIEKAKKAKELIASGGWYSMGGRDTAYRDIYAVEEDGDWSIRGTDMDGKERRIEDAESWDDAVSYIVNHGVSDYRVRSGDTEMGMPVNGMHSVTLLRKPDGGFVVMAATKDQPRTQVYSSDNEADARKWLRDNNIPDSGIKTKGMNPNDDVVRTHTAKSLEGFDAHRAKKEDQFKTITRLSANEKQEVADMLTDLFQNGAYRMRCGGHFEDRFDTHFKNLLETGTSGGSTSKDGRRRTGVESFGHAHDIKPEDAEKYGYLGLEDDSEAWDDDTAEWYGDTIYKFKKDRVKDRVTYSFGDTLDAGRPLVGYAGDKPTIEGISALEHRGGVRDVKEILDTYRQYKKGDVTFNDLRDKINELAQDHYIETHYHGMLTMEDVESIAFPKRKMISEFDRMKPEKRRTVLDFLKNHGITVQYEEGGRLVDAYPFLEDRYKER